LLPIFRRRIERGSPGEIDAAVRCRLVNQRGAPARHVVGAVQEHSGRDELLVGRGEAVEAKAADDLPVFAELQGVDQECRVGVGGGVDRRADPRWRRERQARIGEQQIGSLDPGICQPYRVRCFAGEFHTGDDGVLQESRVEAYRRIGLVIEVRLCAGDGDLVAVDVDVAEWRAACDAWVDHLGFRDPPAAAVAGVAELIAQRDMIVDVVFQLHRADVHVAAEVVAFGETVVGVPRYRCG
jgi:hypothetical protein